ALFSALLLSREAIAATSLHSPFCIAGIAFVRAKCAVLRTPQQTFFGMRLLVEALAVKRNNSAAHGLRLGDVSLASSLEGAKKAHPAAHFNFVSPVIGTRSSGILNAR